MDHNGANIYLRPPNFNSAIVLRKTRWFRPYSFKKTRKPSTEIVLLLL